MFEANGKKIVLQEDIDLQCRKFEDLMIRFGYSYKSIYAKLMGVQGCYYRSGGKQAAILTCTLQAHKLLGVCTTLQEGAELLKMSKDQMRNLDTVIAQNINNQDFPSLSRLGIAENYESNYDTEVYGSVGEYWYSLIGITTDWDDLNKFVYGQCTWYAYNRFKYLHPDADLRDTANYSGELNAKNWLEKNEGRDHLEVRRCGWDDLDPNRLPCIAISENGEYGHVYIVEGVIYDEDGSIKELIISECNGYNHDQNKYSSNGEYNAGVDCVFDKATPSQLGVDGFIYYVP